MTDQQRYRLKEMAAQQSDLIDKLKALRKENELLTFLLGNANEQVAEKDAAIESAFVAGWRGPGFTTDIEIAWMDYLKATNGVT